MAFGNTTLGVTNRATQGNSAQATSTALRELSVAAYPWSFTAKSNVTGADTAWTAYDVRGRNYFSVITYATGSAPASQTVVVWGSQTNLPHSYVSLKTITTLAETVIQGFYNYIVIDVQGVGSNSLSVDFSAARQG